MSRSDSDCLRDILDCIEAIDRAEATVQDYLDDDDLGRVALDAVRYRVLRIGEAVKALSLDLREDHPAVAWSVMERLSDWIDSDDDRLDPSTFHAAVGAPVRQLRVACRAILAEAVRVGEDEP